MRSQRGVTLTSLVAYMIVFTIILTIISIVTSYFYKNVGQIKESPRYISEFNKFSMFFIADVKRNNDITSISSNSLEFADGTKYMYVGDSIYRNDERIARYVKSFAFEESEYTENEFTKKIINVNTVLGGSNESITRNIDFVLRYW